MNAIDHGFWEHSAGVVNCPTGSTRDYSHPVIEAYSSPQGILWTVEQQFGGEKFIQKIEPILKNWPPERTDFTYRNEAGRRRGAGLSNMFSQLRIEQVSYEFTPPYGLKIHILKKKTDIKTLDAPSG